MYCNVLHFAPYICAVDAVSSLPPLTSQYEVKAVVEESYRAEGIEDTDERYVWVAADGEEVIVDVLIYLMNVELHGK